MIAATPARARRGLTKCARSGFCSCLQANDYAPRTSQRRRQSSTATTPARTSSADSPKSNRVIFSGIQPTGVPHLGNYLGALREWVRLQDSSSRDTTLLYSIVDLHALTLPQQPETLRKWSKKSFASLLAVGLDPKRAHIFFQSAVPAHTELMWILSTVSSMGYLSRMTQWKSKLQLPDETPLDDSDARAKLKLGLFSYPVLQAADVLVHGATHIPVGEDQKQHIEFAREVANGFNYFYGRVLHPPDALISPAKRVMSLREPHLKMSKSHPHFASRILLSDAPELINRKIRAAVTDSEPLITYDPERRPGVSNLIEILSHVEDGGRSPQEIAAENENASLKAFKNHVAAQVGEQLTPIRERFQELMSEEGQGHLDDLARTGAEAANKNAAQTMTKVREAMGLWGGT